MSQRFEQVHNTLHQLQKLYFNEIGYSSIHQDPSLDLWDSLDSILQSLLTRTSDECEKLRREVVEKEELVVERANAIGSNIYLNTEWIPLLQRLKNADLALEELTRVELRQHAVEIGTKCSNLVDALSCDKQLSLTGICLNVLLLNMIPSMNDKSQLKRTIRTLNKLYRELSSRRQELLQKLADLIVRYHELNFKLNQTPRTATLDGGLESRLNTLLVNDDDGDDMKCTEKIKKQLENSIQIEQFDLSKDITQLSAVIQMLEQTYQEELAKVHHLTKEIQYLWEELGIPDTDRVELTQDISKYTTYLRILENLKQLWHEMREKTINALLDTLSDLWTKCVLPESDHVAFLDSLGPDKYSTSSLRMLRDKVFELTTRYESTKSLLDLISSRRTLIEKMLSFEITAKDPKRLFRSSFQLLEEERFRKIALPSLLKLEDRIRVETIKWEQENGVFLVGKERWLDKMKNEIELRFFNETVFDMSVTAHGNGSAAGSSDTLVDAIPSAAEKDKSSRGSLKINASASSNAKSTRKISGGSVSNGINGTNGTRSTPSHTRRTSQQGPVVSSKKPTTTTTAKSLLSSTPLTVSHGQVRKRESSVNGVERFRRTDSAKEL